MNELAPEQPSDADPYKQVLTALSKLEEAWSVRYPDLKIYLKCGLGFENGRLWNRKNCDLLTDIIKKGDKESDTNVRYLKYLPVLREDMEEQLRAAARAKEAAQQAEAERLREIESVLPEVLATIKECL